MVYLDSLFAFLLLGNVTYVNLYFQELEAEVVDHRPSLETAKASANALTELNKASPRACAAINDRLNEVTVPLADLMTSLEDRQKKLKNAEELLKKFEDERKPFEEFITAANVTVEEMEPFGFDEEKGKAEVDQLNVCF